MRRSGICARWVSFDTAMFLTARGTLSRFVTIDVSLDAINLARLKLARFNVGHHALLTLMERVPDDRPIRFSATVHVRPDLGPMVTWMASW